MDIVSVQPMPEKTALVLSAGGMFAAYQAGVWKAIAGAFRPDMVIGASAGALNAWAIAGGCPPDELIARWKSQAHADWLRFRRFPLPGRGLVDGAHFQERVRDFFQEFPPRIPIGLVAVDSGCMRSHLSQGSEITWRHLAASCSIPLVLPAQRIQGRRYVDGGLLHALPLWAAREMGATRVVAVNAIPRMPAAIRFAAGSLYWFRGREPWDEAGLRVTRIAPTVPLGSLWEMMRWNRESVERCIDFGYRDGQSITMNLYAELPDLSLEGGGTPAFPRGAAGHGNGQRQAQGLRGNRHDRSA